MLETVLLFVVTAVAGLILFLIAYARWHYGTLEKLGIPVAKPHFIFGSDPDGHKIIYQDRDIERFRKYGPVFGVYEGRQPRVFVIEPDMIRRIMVKDFDHFYDRTPAEWGHEVFDNLLDFLPGEKWKTVRSALTPMFTSSRIRNGSKKYMELTEKYIQEMQKTSKGDRTKIDMKDFMTPVFVEFVSEYILAIKLSGDVRENFIYKMALEAVNDGEEASFAFVLITVYPFILKMFPVFNQDGIKKFLATLEEVIKVRQKENKDTSNGKDFIDVTVTMLEKLESPEYKRLGIDKICIYSQAFEMFIAGFDSILTTLSVIPYFLAENKEAQEKVLKEVDEYLSKPGNGHDGDLSGLTYLAACVREAIRLSPSFHRLERKCMKAWSYTNEEKGINVTLPKGTSVVIPAWATNRNPAVFKDPDTFRPERFLKTSGEQETDGVDSQSQYSFNSFGHGPRNCPGARFGIETVKAGIVSMLKHYTFKLRSDSKVAIQEGIPMLTRYWPIYVDAVKRTPVIINEQ